MAFSGRDDGDDACLELVQWWLIPFGPSEWVCDEHPQLPNMNAQPILNPETIGSQFFVFQSPTQLNWIVTLSRPYSIVGSFPRIEDMSPVHGPSPQGEAPEVK